jgi:phenylacetic acid degradation protein
VPAKVVRTLTDQELAWKLEATATYQRLCVDSRRLMVPCVPLNAPEPDRRRCTEPDVVPLSEFKRRIGAE